MPKTDYDVLNVLEITHNNDVIQIINVDKLKEIRLVETKDVQKESKSAQTQKTSTKTTIKKEIKE